MPQSDGSKNSISKNCNLTFGLKKVEDGIVATQDILPVGISKLVHFLNSQYISNFFSRLSMSKEKNADCVLYSIGPIVAPVSEATQASGPSGTTFFFGGLVLLGTGFLWKQAYVKLITKVVSRIKDEQVTIACEVKKNVVKECYESILRNKSVIMDELTSKNVNFDVNYLRDGRVCNLKSILDEHTSYFWKTYKEHRGITSENINFKFYSQELNRFLSDSLLCKSKFTFWEKAYIQGNNLSLELTNLNKTIVSKSIDFFCKNQDCYAGFNLHLVPNTPSLWEIFRDKVILEPLFIVPEVAFLGVTIAAARVLSNWLGITKSRYGSIFGKIATIFGIPVW